MRCLNLIFFIFHVHEFLVETPIKNLRDLHWRHSLVPAYPMLSTGDVSFSLYQ